MDKEQWIETLNHMSIIDLISINNTCLDFACDSDYGLEDLADQVVRFYDMSDFNEEMRDVSPSELADIMSRATFKKTDYYFYFTLPDRCGMMDLISVSPNTKEDVPIDINVLVDIILSDPDIESYICEYYL